MSLKSIRPFVQQKLKELFPANTNEIQFGSVGGGCINETHKINFGNHQFFCKTNSAVKFPQLFEKESHGLKLIAKQNIIKVPAVIDFFETDGQQVLLLEWINRANPLKTFGKSSVNN